MDVCSKILKESQTDNFEFTSKIFDLILEEFLEQTNIIFDFDYISTSMEKVFYLKKEYILTSEYSEYVNLFFEVLRKYNYDMKFEIKDAMFQLGHLKNPSNNQKVINRLLNSPFIQDISFDGKSIFTIFSEQYGTFVFELASYYFRSNSKMTDYINNNILENRCHQHTFFMSEVFDEFYAITSLCKYYFKYGYYHSYTYNKKDNIVIDLCSNAVINKDSFDYIYEPKELSVILNSNVKKELELTDLNTNQPYNLCELLKIALYKQYLVSIQQGDLSEKVYTKKLI